MAILGSTCSMYSIFLFITLLTYLTAIMKDRVGEHFISKEDMTHIKDIRHNKRLAAHKKIDKLVTSAMNAHFSDKERDEIMKKIGILYSHENSLLRSQEDMESWGYLAAEDTFINEMNNVIYEVDKKIKERQGQEL